MRLNARRHGYWLMLGSLPLLYIPQALAYLDPATGSMIIQGIIGAIAAAIVAIRMYWHSLKAWLNKLTGKRSASPPKSDAALRRESSVSERD